MSRRPIERLVKAKPTLEGAGAHLWRAPCITSSGTVILFRSLVKSVCEKATMPP